MNQVSPPSIERQSWLQNVVSFSRFELLSASFAFLVSTSVYVYSVAPTITFGDSGELVTAAFRLGVAHPPGYPLWLLMGKLFSLFPVGAVAYRLNLMSALFNGAAVGLLALIIAKTFPQVAARLIPADMVGSKTAGLLIASASATAALSLSFSTTFWQQSVSAEVYALNNFFGCLILLLMINWAGSPEKNAPLFLTTFLFGLGLGNHQTLALLIPAAGLYVLLVKPKAVISPRSFLGCGLFFLLGLAVYLYLPICAAAHPPLNWGDPTTWDSFLFHVLRKQYRSLGMVRPLSVIAGQVMFFFNSTAKEFSQLILLVPALLTIWAATREGRKWLIFTLSGFICTGVLLMIIANTELDLSAQDLLRIYFLPPWVFVAIWLGYGIGALNLLSLRALRSYRWGGLPAALLAALWLLLPLGCIGRNYQAASLRGHDFGRRYGELLLRDLPDGAVVFAGTDSAYAIPMYMKWVQGLRPDVTILSVNRLSDVSYRAEAERNTVGFGFLRDEDYAEAFSMYAAPSNAGNGIYGSHKVGQLNAYLLLKLYRNIASTRPVYYDQGLPIDWIADFAAPSGLLVELKSKKVEALSPDVIASDRLFWHALEDTLFSNEHFLHDRAARQKFSKCRSNIGYVYLRRKLYGEAAEALKQAIRFSDTNIEAYAFLALGYKEQGEREKAVSVFSEYLRKDTWNTSARAFADALAR